MAKVKVKDQEFEVPDEIASLVADETGVPFRNRAAEARRKQEKYEKELEELRAAQTKQPPVQQQRSVPQVQQVPYDPNSFRVPAAQFQFPQQQPQVSVEEMRELAREEARKIREAEEYRVEQGRLAEEWKSFDDEKEQASEYLRSKGYLDEQIANFGPRDWRLVKDAMESKKQTKAPAKRSPQEVVLDTSGGGGIEELADGPYSEEKIRGWDRAKLREEILKAKSRPRVDEE